ncbi:MAG: hypothetical protein ACRYGI_11610 [Janthinobacterium lividum]
MTAGNAELVALAERCEQATGADRRLDAEIWVLVGDKLGSAWSAKSRDPIKPSEVVQGELLAPAILRWPLDPGGVANSWRVPFLTDSLDAAMTLVPEGIRIGLVQQPGGEWEASDIALVDNEGCDHGHWEPTFRTSTSAACAVSAVALDALAALRALAPLSHGERGGEG